MKKTPDDNGMRPLVNKLLRIMKLSVFFILSTMVAVFATESYSQTALTLESKGETLESVLKSIEKKSEFKFFYSGKINVDQKINIQFKDKKIDEILNQLGEVADFDYEIADRQIVLKMKDSKASMEDEKVTISGRVVSEEDGEGLPGVNVIEDGTSNGVVTDVDGNYRLTVSSDANIIFSYVGYTAVSQSVAGRSVIDVTMTADVQALEELVVIGYGSQKKSTLTGAVSSVKSEDMEMSVLPSIGHMLQGKAAGLNIRTESAQPGGGITFNIRGLASTGIGNEPLIVIDGYPITNNNIDPNANGNYGVGAKNTVLSSINPDDIESVEILKDASATAIYGARAGHGVIIITTKRGQEGSTNVEYSNSFAWQQLANKPEMLNGPDYMTQVNRVLKEQWMHENDVFPYGNKVPSEVLTPFAPQFSRQEIDQALTTDWYDEVTRTGFLQQHNISVKSGNEKSRYLFSTNYYDHKGVVEGNNFKRITGRLNLDQKFGDYISGGSSLMFSNIKNNNYASNNAGEAGDGGIIGNALGFPSMLPIRDSEGRFQGNIFQPQMPNPVSMMDIQNVSSNDRFLLNTYLEVEPIENLKFRGTIGFDKQIGKGQAYLPTTTLVGAKSGGRADQTVNDLFNWQYDFTISWNKQIGLSNNVTLLGGHSRQEFSNEGFSAGNAKFVTDSYYWNNLAQGELERPDVSSYAFKGEMASFFGRLMYNYKEKYLLTATMRADGSSDFAANNKWGYFPSVALAWRVDQESFFPSTKALSSMKFRASWGQTGNAGLGGNASAYYGNAWHPFVFGNVINNGIRLVQIGNPDLKWETTTEINLGADLGLFNNRVTIAYEYYQRVISDLLSTKTLPSYLEINTVAANIGETQSEGMELTITSVNVDRTNFSWKTTFTGSYYNDRWRKRDESWVPRPWETATGAIRQDAGFLSDGLIEIGEVVPHMPNATPGQVKLKDLDGFMRDANGNVVYDDVTKKALKTGQPDGVLDEADYVIYHEDKPFFLGLSNMFTFRNFDLNIDIYAVLNRKGWNQQAYYTTAAAVTSGQNVLTSTKDVWAHDNTGGTLPNSVGGAYSWGDFTYQDMSFLRVRNITLGYTFPKSALPKFVGGIRVFTGLTNPFLITNYEGQDPETDFSFASYPNQKTVSCGLNITL